MEGDDPAASYAGFWWRFLASLLDSLIVGVLSFALGVLLLRSDADGDVVLFNFGYNPTTGRLAAGVHGAVVFLGVAYVLAFWIARQATPGKLAVRTRIVDARTGGKPSVGQFVLRYLGYFLSALPLSLGFLSVAFDRRKQGWHDKIAGTVVVRRSGTEPVRFEAAPLPAPPPVP